MTIPLRTALLKACVTADKLTGDRLWLLGWHVMHGYTPPEDVRLQAVADHLEANALRRESRRCRDDA